MNNLGAKSSQSCQELPPNFPTRLSAEHSQTDNSHFPVSFRLHPQANNINQGYKSPLAFNLQSPYKARLKKGCRPNSRKATNEDSIKQDNWQNKVQEMSRNFENMSTEPWTSSKYQQNSRFDNSSDNEDRGRANQRWQGDCSLHSFEYRTRVGPSSKEEDRTSKFNSSFSSKQNNPVLLESSQQFSSLLQDNQFQKSTIDGLHHDIQNMKNDFGLRGGLETHRTTHQAKVSNFSSATISESELKKTNSSLTQQMDTLRKDIEGKDKMNNYLEQQCRQYISRYEQNLLLSQQEAEKSQTREQGLLKQIAELQKIIDGKKWQRSEKEIDLQEEVKRRAEEISNLNSLIEVQRSKLAEQQKQNKSDRAQISVLLMRLQNMQNKSESLNQLLVHQTKLASSLESQLLQETKEWKIQIDEVSKKKDMALKEVNESQNKNAIIDNLRKSIVLLQQKFDAKQQILQKESINNKNIIVELERVVQQKLKTLTEIAISKSNLEDELSRLKQNQNKEVQVLNQKMQNLTKTLNHSTSSLLTADKSNFELKNRLNQALKENIARQREVGQVKKQLEQSLQQLKQELSKKQNLEREIEELKNQFNQLNQKAYEKLILEGQTQGLKKSFEKSQAQLSQEIQKNMIIKKEKEELKSQLEQFSVQINQERQKNVMILREKEELKSQLEQFSVQINQERQKNVMILREKEELKSQLEQFSVQINQERQKNVMILREKEELKSQLEQFSVQINQERQKNVMILREKEELKSQLEQFSVQINQERQKNVMILREKEELKSQLEQFSVQINQERQKNVMILREKEELKSQLEQFSVQINQERQKNVITNQEKAELTNQHEQYLVQVNQERQKNMRLEKEAEDLKKQLLHKISQEIPVKEGSDKEIEELAIQLLQSQAQLTEEINKNKRTEIEIERVKRELQKSQSSQNMIVRQLQKLQEELNISRQHISSENTMSQVIVKQLQQKISFLESDKDCLETELIQTRDILLEEQHKMTCLQETSMNELQNARSEIENLKTEIFELFKKETSISGQPENNTVIVQSQPSEEQSEFIEVDKKGIQYIGHLLGYDAFAEEGTLNCLIKRLIVFLNDFQTKEKYCCFFMEVLDIFGIKDDSACQEKLLFEIQHFRENVDILLQRIKQLELEKDQLLGDKKRNRKEVSLDTNQRMKMMERQLYLFRCLNDSLNEQMMRLTAKVSNSRMQTKLALSEMLEDKDWQSEVSIGSGQLYLTANSIHSSDI